MRKKTGRNKRAILSRYQGVLKTHEYLSPGRVGTIASIPVPRTSRVGTCPPSFSL